MSRTVHVTGHTTKNGTVVPDHTAVIADKKQNSESDVNLAALVARPHISDSPVIYTVDFPNFSDDERAEVRSGLESGDNEEERNSLVRVAQALDITWNDPFDEDEEDVDRSAEPQNETATMIRRALEDEDHDDVRDALVDLADEYEVTYGDSDDDDRRCGCGARHAVHVDEVDDDAITDYKVIAGVADHVTEFLSGSLEDLTAATARTITELDGGHMAMKPQIAVKGDNVDLYYVTKADEAAGTALRLTLNRDGVLVSAGDGLYWYEDNFDNEQFNRLGMLGFSDC